MAEIILLVFEGEKTEVRIYNKLSEMYFKSDKNTILISTYNTNIYQLWKELSEDEYLDVVELIRDKSESNKDTLKDISRDQISQVYLFFDHEGHDPNAKDVKLEEMLQFHDEETSHGKLYISYPMVEALKDFSVTTEYKNRVWLIDNNVEYKKDVGNNTVYQDLRRITKEDWDNIISENLKKGNLIVNDDYSIIPFDDLYQISQISIFDKQQEKFINRHGLVSVLSGFPFFIAEYFGESQYIKFNME